MNVITCVQQACRSNDRWSVKCRAPAADLLHWMATCVHKRAAGSQEHARHPINLGRLEEMRDFFKLHALTAPQAHICSALHCRDMPYSLSALCEQKSHAAKLKLLF